jgi:hypothetical protein
MGKGMAKRGFLHGMGTGNGMQGTK